LDTKVQGTLLGVALLWSAEAEALGNGVCGVPPLRHERAKTGQDRLCGANETNRFSSLLLPRGGPPPVDDESKSSGECLAAAVHWEGNAGSFDCALLASLTTLRSG